MSADYLKVPEVCIGFGESRRYEDAKKNMFIRVVKNINKERKR
jgi:hypothetical protein